MPAFSDSKCVCCQNLTLELASKNGCSCLCCSGCGFEDYSRGYRVQAEDYQSSKKYSDYHAGRPTLSWHHRVALTVLQDSIDTGGGRRYATPKVLDVGCYDGFFVKAMVDKNINAFGCDWNAKSIEFGKKKYALETRIAEKIQGTFDVITCLEVIEHVESPREFVDDVKSRLEPGGYLIVSCPNRDSIYRPMTDYPPHHLSRFSTEALASLLEGSGFEIMLHRVEFGAFQLLRNFVGDWVRRVRRSRDAGIDANDNAEGGFAQFDSQLKRAVNSMSLVLRHALLPVDGLMWFLGKPYIGQVCVARLRSEYSD